MKVLITGVAGRMGRCLAFELLQEGHEVVGVDRRPWPSAPRQLVFHCGDLRKRPAEDLFRTQRPHAVVHMATVSHLTDDEDRRRNNLEGTQAVFDYADAHGVERVVFVGRHTYYGAVPDAPLYHTEADPPLAVHTFPELADLVAADLYAGSGLWRFPGIDTVVLRPCYTLGSLGHGTLAAYLAGRRVPTVLGYDPLFQFVHEQDLVQAISVALKRRIRGVFNVVGPNPVSLSILIRETGRQPTPLPASMLPHVLGRFGFPSLPPGAIAHLKYPVVIDGDAFVAATGFRHIHDDRQTMAAFRRAFPVA